MPYFLEQAVYNLSSSFVYISRERQWQREGMGVILGKVIYKPKTETKLEILPNYEKLLLKLIHKLNKCADIQVNQQ